MFLDFFLLLKKQGVPVTLTEFLTLLGGLQKKVVRNSVEDFYALSKVILIKNEKHLDLFDRLFGLYFKGIETIPDEEFYKIPEAWLAKNKEQMLTPELMEQVKAMGGLDKLLERIQELLNEQKERHEGGNKWIGTGGTSPFGAYGYNPEGIRIGQHESRHRRAIKVWDKRMFKDLDGNNQLETRNMKMALRNLRILTRIGQPSELDLQSTIQSTSEKAGMLDIKMMAQKKNNVKVLLMFDIGGSMDDHIELCAQLFSAAKYEFKNMQFYYFHNCVYERLWSDNTRRWDEYLSTYEILNKFNNDYKVILVGDAAMSPYELHAKYGSVEHYNEEPGLEWMARLKKQFPSMVWLNPVPEQEWKFTQSIGMLKTFMDDQMYPLTINGIKQAVEALKK